MRIIQLLKLFYILQYKCSLNLLVFFRQSEVLFVSGTACWSNNRTLVKTILFRRRITKDYHQDTEQPGNQHNLVDHNGCAFVNSANCAASSHPFECTNWAGCHRTRFRSPCGALMFLTEITLFWKLFEEVFVPPSARSDKQLDLIVSKRLKPVSGFFICNSDVAETY